MEFKIVLLSLILMEFLCLISAECEVKRVPRSNNAKEEKAKFYVECPLVDDPMLQMASENKQLMQNSGLSKLLRSAEPAKKPVLRKSAFPKKPLSLDKYNLPSVNDLIPPPETLRMKPELPKLNLDDLKLRSPLGEKIRNELPSPNLDNFLQDPADLVDDGKHIVSNLRNMFDKPPQGRFSNSLKDILARKSADLNQSPSDIIEDEEDLLPLEPTLAEKLHSIAENQRKALEEALKDARDKLKISSKLGDLEAKASNNKFLDERSHSEDTGLANELSDHAEILKRKIMNKLKPNIERTKPLLRSEGDLQVLRNSDGISQIDTKPAADMLNAFVEKTKTVARKFKKLVDFDTPDDLENVNALRKAEQQALEKRRKFPYFEKTSLREDEPEVEETPAEKIKKHLEESKRRAEALFSTARKADPDIGESNHEAILDSLPDKVLTARGRVMDKFQEIADKLKDAISNADKMRSAPDSDSSVDASNLEEIVHEVPSENSDVEQEISDGVSQRAADEKDDIFDLTEEGSKTANICKCIRVAFPEKFENGHFVMNARNADTERSSSSLLNEELIPKINRIPSSSILGNKLKNVFRTRGVDLAGSANEMNPIYEVAPEGMGDNASGVEKAKLADKGIRSLLEFIKIVDQVDQYITTKARRAISRLATVLTEDEDARLL